VEFNNEALLPFVDVSRTVSLYRTSLEGDQNGVSGFQLTISTFRFFSVASRMPGCTTAPASSAVRISWRVNRELCSAQTFL
jgi:hypothetical protein